jgi:hypothetical protein
MLLLITVALFIYCFGIVKFIYTTFLPQLLSNIELLLPAFELMLYFVMGGFIFYHFQFFTLIYVLLIIGSLISFKGIYITIKEYNINNNNLE